MELAGLKNVYPSANLAFSPNGSWLVCTTSLDKTNREQKSALHLFQVPKPAMVGLRKPAPPTEDPKQTLVIGVSGPPVDGMLVFSSHI